MEPASKPARRVRRLWILAFAGALPFLAYYGFSVFAPEMDRNIRTWLTFGFALIGIILAFLWLLLFSGISWWKRLLWLAVAGVAWFGLRRLFRVDGAINGTGLPRLAWRWAPTKDERLAESLRVDQAPPGAVQTGTIAPFPQFLGPDRRNVINGARLERDWVLHPPRLLWRQPVGVGWSGFAVSGDTAVTQEQRGPNELVTARDLRTGNLRWAHTNEVRFAEWQGGDGPRATPTIADGVVYSLGATGILDALALADGRPQWTHNVFTDGGGGNLTWGKSCSPLVYGDSALVTGGAGGATLLAYRRDSGALAWKIIDDDPSYASPTLVDLAGRKVVLSLNAHSLTAHDPDTGKVLLKFPWLPEARWPRAAQPVVIGADRVFLSAGYGAGCILIKIASDASTGMTATVEWKTKSLKTQFNNVSFRDGRLYGLDDGLLACVDVATGQRVWKDGRYGQGQSLMVDDLLIVQAETGPVALVEASPLGFHELGRVEALNAKTWNNPALATPYLLVRNDQEAACYELPVLPRAVAAR